MSLLKEAKKISNENEKSSREDQMISLLYSFKKNITSQDPFYPLNNLLSKKIHTVGKVVAFVHILKKSWSIFTPMLILN